MGRVYQRKQRDGSLGTIWWFDYYDSAGKRWRVSSETENEREAERQLKIKEGRVATGEPVIAGRAKWDDVRDALVAHYKSTGERDLEEVTYRLKHLDYFNGQRVEAISGAAIARYIAKRQEEVKVSPVLGITKKPANGTVNREVSVLMRALRLAVEQGRLSRVPIVHKAKEAAPRAGFFEVDAFEAVRARLPLDLQAAVSISYELGWRTQSEVMPLELRQLDLDAGTLSLDPGSTKNDDGRVVYLTAALLARLRDHVERVHELAHQMQRVPRWLFPIFPGPYIPKRLVGRRRRDFRKAWATACEAAGYPGAIRHDFRRSATRNIVNAGVPERVAMQVTGHKTRAVFDRYHIVSPSDLQSAATKLETASRAALGTTTGTTGLVQALRPIKRAGRTGG